MRLKDFKDDIKGQIVRDSIFSQLGHSSVSKIKNLLTFCDDENYVDVILNNNNINCVITTSNLANNFNMKNLGLIISKDPRLDFFSIHNKTSIKIKRKKTEIGFNFKKGSNCQIASNNVVIGNNCYFEDGVIIHENVEIGDDVIIEDL